MIKASSIRALLLLAFVIPLSAAAEDGDEISMRIAENSEAIAERTRTLLEHRLEEEVLRLPEQSDLDKSEARRLGAPRDTIGDRRGAEAPVRAAAAPGTWTRDSHALRGTPIRPRSPAWPARPVRCVP